MIIGLDWQPLLITLFLLFVVLVLYLRSHTDQAMKIIGPAPGEDSDVPANHDYDSFLSHDKYRSDARSFVRLEPQHLPKQQLDAASLLEPASQPRNVPTTAQVPAARAEQFMDAFLVFDVEATCVSGSDFNWCNEIIEWPVVLLRWADKGLDGTASHLVKVDEFHSFVRPTFRPVLSEFCTTLTGVTQAQVDNAPTFPEMLMLFKAWMVMHRLIEPISERPIQRFLWCTDGPCDVRDFAVKQCFISKVKLPEWLSMNVMDSRRTVVEHLFALKQKAHENDSPRRGRGRGRQMHYRPPKGQSLNIEAQLDRLLLPAFQGRQHSGIDDTRNISRIVTELGRRGVQLKANIAINPNRRWYWMGSRPGEVIL